MKPHVVGMPVTPAAWIFGIAVPCEIFGRYREGLPKPWYDLRICAPPGPPVHVSNGFISDTRYGYDELARADTVIVTAMADTHEPPAELIAAVQAAHRNGARIVSLCTGAFVLAAAGILDGRPATTHWFHARELA